MVAVQQLERLAGFVLVDAQPQLGMSDGEPPHEREHHVADRGAEGSDAQGPPRRRIGVEIGSCRVQSRQHVDGVVRQPTAGRREAHTATLVLEQRGPGLLGERRDLLGDRRGGHPHDIGHSAHGAQAGELEEQLEPTRVHAAIVQKNLNASSIRVTWT